MVLRPHTEKEVSVALAYISRTSNTKSEGSNSHTSEISGITFTDLQNFSREIRSVKSEFSDALINKMFYSCSAKQILSLEDAFAAESHQDYGYDWRHLFALALNQAEVEKHAQKASKKKKSKKAEGDHLPSIQSSPRSPRVDPAASIRRSRVNRIVDEAQESAAARTSPPSKPQLFPTWSIHSDDKFSDAFDKLRVNSNGVSLEAAREMEIENRRNEVRRIHPNENGAIVVNNSPRNHGQPVVIVDATSEKQRMQRALDRQAELKKLLALGGTSVEKYLRNELTIAGGGSGTQPGKESLRPTDYGYQRTMTAIVDFLQSSPRTSAGSHHR